jgi:phytoene desaturase
MSVVSVIGGGVSGLSAACFLADAGLDVTVMEQNATIGGRARTLYKDGFIFDMGPSWYWMPDVFEDFFNHFGKSAVSYYDLVKLDPGFQIIFGKDDVLKVPAGMDELLKVFENRETGSSVKLKGFLKDAASKYAIGMKDLIKMPAYSLLEFAKPAILGAVFKMDLFRSVRTHVRKYFKDPGLISLLEFPALFLGAMPDKIPALYTLMNHAALTQGTCYPMGGMGKLIDGISALAQSLGVQISTSSVVEHINIEKGQANSITVNGKRQSTAGIIASGDYQHTEQVLLDSEHRNYPAAYWDKKTFAPSCLIFYLGINKKLAKLEHHNLFFDTDFDQHAKDIYAAPKWPEDPLCYVCCPSHTDPSVAPEGMENLFVLIPIAPGLDDTDAIRAHYYELIIEKLSAFCQLDLKAHIVVKETYSINNFIKDYNAFRGNAYGLANTLRQTAILKPSLRNKKVSNLFYTGQLTVPGPGLPPSLISGEIAAKELIRQLQKNYK